MVHKQLLRDTNVPLARPDDQRQLDMVVYGMTSRGIPLCCDATLVSPLSRCGQPRPGAATTDGVAMRQAERRKQQRYPELLQGNYGKLVVLASETGGRWNSQAQRLVGVFAKQKARAAPTLLRKSARAAWSNRWWGLLSIATQASLAATLIADGHLALSGATGRDELHLADILQDAHIAPPASRLPLR